MRWTNEDTPEQEAFRTGFRSWLHDNLPAGWMEAADTGDDETPACTRVFDLAQVASPGPGRLREAAEIAVLHGPEGRFFSDGTTLLSSGEDGLSRWDPLTGTRTGFTPGFTPAYFHPATRELVELSGGKLRRARYA